MKLGAYTLCFLGSIGAAVGCSGGSDDPFGPDPDFGSTREDLRNASGAFASGQESALFSTWLDRKTTQSSIALGALAAKAVGETSASADASGRASLAARIGGAAFCPALHRGDATGACGCPGGGTLFYDTAALKTIVGESPAVIRVRYEACGVGGAILDGREFMRVEGRQADVEVLASASLTVRADGKTTSVDLGLLYEDGRWWTRVEATGGALVVGSSSGETDGLRVFVVKDREATWSCSVRRGAQAVTVLEPSPWKGACTSNRDEERSVGGD